MNVDFFANIDGNSGISIYSRELYEELEERVDIDNIEPYSFLKPYFLNQVLLNPIKISQSNAGLVHITNQDLMSSLIPTKTDNLVVTVHDIFPYLGYSGPIYSWMARRYVKNIERNADKVIAISEATKEQLIEHTKLDQDKIEVVYQGVDLKTFQPADSDTEYGKFFLHVGHELDRKNIKGLVRVFEEIKKQQPDAKLVRIGNDDKSRSILESSELVIGEDVFYEENIDVHRLVKLYSDAEKLLFPSEGEGLGRPIIESLACGTPVVAFDKKPMSEILPESMLVEWGDTESFVSKAIDKGESKNKCRDIASKFTWKKTAEKTIEVYEECLEQQ